MATIFLVVGARPSDDDEYEDDIDFSPLFLLPGIAYAISTVIGISHGNECDRAWKQHRAWLKQNRLDQGCERYLSEWHRTEVTRRWLVLYDEMPPPCQKELDDSRPRTGTAGGFCYRNRSCDQGNRCHAGVCRPGPSEGEAGGSCYPNCTCDAGLSCHQGTCRPGKKVKQ